MTGTFRVAMVFLMVAVSMTLAGCGIATPDVSGEWGGRLVLHDENMSDGVRDFDIAFDIEQSDDRDLSGTGELEAEFDEELEHETVQISGTIDDEGELRILFGTSPPMDNLGFDLSGQVEDDKVAGTAFVQMEDGGSEAAFEVARGAEFGADPAGDTEEMKSLLRRDATGDLENGRENYDEHWTEIADLLEGVESVLTTYEENVQSRKNLLSHAQAAIQEERANPTPPDAVFGPCGAFDTPDLYDPDGDYDSAMREIDEEMAMAVSFNGITNEPQETYPELKTAIEEERDELLETAEDYREDFVQFKEAGGTPGEEGTPREKDIVLMEEDAEERTLAIKQLLKEADSQRDEYVKQAEMATEELRGIYQEVGCI